MRVERWTSPTGKVRLLTRLDARRSERYALAAGLAVPHRIREERSFGSVRPGGARPAWPDERRAWRRALRRAVDDAEVVLTSDVLDCYPSIGEGAIRRAATWTGGDPEALIACLTECWDAGIAGLPIGPDASSVVADAVLSIADARARAAGLQPVRWVDDVVFAGDRAAVARGARAWRVALGDLGLREHEGKRRTYVDRTATVGAILPRTSLAARGDRGIMRSS
jgi:hypothetical protein